MILIGVALSGHKASTHDFVMGDQENQQFGLCTLSGTPHLEKSHDPGSTEAGISPLSIFLHILLVL